MLEFVKAINKLLPDNVSQIPETDYEISNQFSYMDGFIYKQNECCIIIENKIHWAKDQYKQIESYIKSSSNDVSIDKQKIYFVYLTSDGNKKPSTESFTYEAKDILGYTDEENPGRFIQMNYRDHILPFLNNVLEMASFSKENILKTAVVQYINHLEGCFGLRKSEEEYKNVMMEKLSEVLLKECANEVERLNKIKETQTAVYVMLENLKKSISNPEEWAKQTKVLMDKAVLPVICTNKEIVKDKNDYCGLKLTIKLAGKDYVIAVSSGWNPYGGSYNNSYIEVYITPNKTKKYDDILKNHNFKPVGNLFCQYIIPRDLGKLTKCIKNLLEDLEKVNDFAK